MLAEKKILAWASKNQDVNLQIPFVPNKNVTNNIASTKNSSRDTVIAIGLNHVLDCPMLQMLSLNL